VATSLFFEFPNSSRELFTRANSKAEWYEAVQVAGADGAPQLNAQDASPAWHYTLAATRVVGAIGSLFVGDLRSGTEASADPEVVFHCADSVRDIARDLTEHGEAFFRSLLAQHGHECESWLYTPLVEFFSLAAKRGNAVVLVWGV
jgi:hypothetical protein